MKNFSNTIVYLTAEGASKMFGNAAVVNLPVIPTDPNTVNGNIVYGDTFEALHGHCIGGSVSQEYLTDTVPTDEQKIAAVDAYTNHQKQHFSNVVREQHDIVALLQRQDEVLDLYSNEAKVRSESRK